MTNKDIIAPEKYNIIQEFEQFTSDPERLALVWQSEAGEEKQITYDELIKGANKIGNVFKKQGLKKGDAILVMLPRLIEAYQTYIAALKIGLIVAPSSELLRASDLQYRINHGDIKAVVSYHPYVDRFNDVEEVQKVERFVVGGDTDNWTNLVAAAESESDELEMSDTTRDSTAFLSFTSGTTGNPKAVIHAHGWGLYTSSFSS